VIGETIGNPGMDVPDLPALGALARRIARDRRTLSGSCHSVFSA